MLYAPVCVCLCVCVCGSLQVYVLFAWRCVGRKGVTCAFCVKKHHTCIPGHSYSLYFFVLLFTSLSLSLSVSLSLILSVLLSRTTPCGRYSEPVGNPTPPQHARTLKSTQNTVTYSTLSVICVSWSHQSLSVLIWVRLSVCVCECVCISALCVCVCVCVCMCVCSSLLQEFFLSPFHRAGLTCPPPTHTLTHAHRGKGSVTVSHTDTQTHARTHTHTQE